GRDGEDESGRRNSRGKKLRRQREDGVENITIALLTNRAVVLRKLWTTENDSRTGQIAERRGIRHAAAASDCCRKSGIVIKRRANDVSALGANLAGAAQYTKILHTKTDV